MVNNRDADAAGRAHAPLKAYSDSTERYTGALFCTLSVAAKLRLLSRYNCSAATNCRADAEATAVGEPPGAWPCSGTAR